MPAWMDANAPPWRDGHCRLGTLKIARDPAGSILALYNSETMALYDSEMSKGNIPKLQNCDKTHRTTKRNCKIKPSHAGWRQGFVRQTSSPNSASVRSAQELAETPFCRRHSPWEATPPGMPRLSAAATRSTCVRELNGSELHSAAKLHAPT